ncbi:hypothetical protein NQ315_001922 [Exocentrus adspersus]|uniref:Arginyl-tRNA--protein transferase 1 n=1 Tax=Exocentrus adspersus TaxID=1586481 RepID=A0AAV8W9T9_9CUCU|nr:hypothetical protein NQ315_001922 [Exocentrus adspersus]
MDVSVAYWYPDTEKHKCGYCKNEFGSISNGMWTDTLTVEDYQNLIDRGWRRSGKYCYKPIMQETCCPQYTIKCDILNFSLSKSQKKVIKKFNKFLEDGVLNKNEATAETHRNDEQDNPEVIIKDRPNVNFSRIDTSQVEMNKPQVDIKGFIKDQICDKTIRIAQESTCDPSSSNSTLQRKYDLKNTYREGVGADTSKPPCKKAKLLRFERKKEKLGKCGLSLGKKDPVQFGKSIEQLMEEVSNDSSCKLRLEFIPTSEPGDEWDQVKEVEFELYKKYQMIVHNDPPTKLSMKSFHRFLVNSPLKITLTRMSRDHEYFADSAKLYEKYQTAIHNESAEDNSPDQFHSFLVQTPLEPVDFPDGIDGPGFGSFHQQYWLDDKLVAVGVIDILPRCVSSVYFFYDPDYRSLTLGTYGCLREVQFTRSLHRKIPELSSYYMGFYIHSCQKMRYKGKLAPSLLLCPETYHWIPIEKCLPKLEASKYSRLEEDIDAVDENFPATKDIDEMKIIYNYQLTYFKQYKRYRIEEQSLFTEIGTLIGKKCIKTIVFCVQ